MAVNRRKLGALLFALVATAAAASAASASHTGTPGVTKKQIVIGGTFPLTGPAALYATIPAAEAAYYAYVNAHGGVFHRKIVVLSFPRWFLQPISDPDWHKREANYNKERRLQHLLKCKTERARGRGYSPAGTLPTAVRLPACGRSKPAT